MASRSGTEPSDVDAKPLVFAALADDVTGGIELAALLARRGVRCAFLTDWRLVEGVRSRVDAVVLAQKTRVIPASQAVEAFDVGWRALRPARQFFYKYCATFDSTSAGNIGPCADLLMERTGAELTLFCPSFPEAGRYVFQGHLFVGDRLVSESPKRFDPLTPMTDPDLVRVLASQTRRHVGLLPFHALRVDPQAYASRLRAQGTSYAVADAATEDDLGRLAALTVEWPLMTGGSSLADHYPELWRQRGWIARSRTVPTLPPVDGQGVVLAGSCSDVTLGQLAHFASTYPLLTLDITASDEDSLVAYALDWADSRLPREPVAIATSAAPEAVRHAQEALGFAEATARAERILGRLAVLLRDSGVRRFVVAGGETSGTVLEKLGIRQLQVGPYEQAGVARAVTCDERPLALCLKSGKLGPPDMFLRILRSMQTGELA